MNERWLKMCSMLLVMCMIFNMLPMGVFAQQALAADAETAQQAQASDAETAQQQEEPEMDFSEAEIVEELTEKRDAYTKSFRLDNGLNVAVSYGEPVHYETAAGWEEIDNTLTAQADGSYSNTAGNWDVHFPGYLNSGSVEIEKDGYKLSFSISGELHIGKNRAADTVEKARISAAQVRREDPAQQEQKAYAIHKNRAQMQYANVYENTDIVYDLVGNSLKESIVLSSYRSSLQGYRYSLHTGTMVPVLEENGQITLYDPTQKEVILVMPAPYLVDADNTYNYDVQVTLAGSNGTYTLTYLLPQQWLAAEDRAWPVVLDPIVKAELNANNIRDKSVSSGGTSNVIDGQLDATLDCGYNTKRGQQRFYVKYAQLPTMKSSETVVEAVMCLRTVIGYTGKVPVTVHKVLDTWEPETLTWNNQPRFSSIVEDYSIVGASSIYTQYDWNVTDLVRDWYTDKGNTGMMFQVPQSVIDQGINSLREFCSSDYGSAASRPTLFVYYRDTSGIESHFSYQTMSAGHAGSAYISDSTGQLNVVKQLASYSSTINPFTLNMVYNSNFFQVEEKGEGSVQDVHGVDMQFGKGITWDMIQSIEEAELENAYGKYLVWHDGDGTDHYFLKQSDGKYLHEDGRDLTVTKSGNQYTMTDAQGNKWLFDNGLLYKYQDESGNTTVIQWQGSSSSRYFYRIYQQNNGQTTGTDLVNVTYTSGSYINTLTDAAGRVFKFEYTGGKLTSIKMDNTAIAQYTYAANGLQEMQNKESGYKLCFTYDGNSRIASYQEKTATGETGALAQITYHKDMTVYRDCGADRHLPSSDDLLTYYSFDYWGKTVNACTKDTQGKVLGTSTATYTQNKTDTAQQLRNNNRILQTASTGMAAQNLLLNGSFESDTNQWTIEAPGSASITQSTYTHHSGSNSLQGYIPSGYTNTISAYCSQTLTKGKQYTFSAYVDTSWISSYGSSGGIRLLVSEPNVTQWVSKTLNYDTTGTDGGWVRLSVTFTAGASVSYAFMIQAWGMTGWFYADDFQLEEAEAPSNYNLIQNGNMQSEDTWLHDGGLYYATETGTNNKVLSLQGSLQQDICAWQNVRLMQPSSQTYVLSGWGWADSVPDNDDPGSNENYASDTTKRFGLQAILHYLSSDETDAPDTEYHYVPFNPDVAGWQFTAITIVPKQENRTVHYIQVVCAYEKNANVAWFDNLSLTMEAAQSMRYDAEGNLVSVTTTGLEETESTYDNGNLIETQTGGFGTYTYTYDEDIKHRLLTATDGIVEQSYGYDSYGNVNSTTLKNGDITMRTSASYTSKGNLLGTVTDANGDSVEYVYDGSFYKALGLPTSVTDGNNTTTYKGYDNFGRTRSSSLTNHSANGVANLAKIEYAYSEGLLTKVTRNNEQYYSFVYDDWGNRTQLKVGNQSLSTHTYAPNNGYLTCQTFGNKDKVEYTYDNLGRVTKEVYSDYKGQSEDGTDIYAATRTLTYTYTGDGQLHSIHDSQGNKTTRFIYDSLGRLVYSQDEDVRSSAAYNPYNQLIRQDFVSFLSKDYVTYTYDTNKENGLSDGKLTAMQMVSGGTISYAYDGLQRLVHKHNTAGVWETFAYDNTQVSSKINYMGNTRLHTLLYQYDSNGNITKETTVVNSVATSRNYTYDKLNQLTGVTGTSTENYIYDTYGNITSFDNSKISHTLTYDNTDWKDLLTAVDGKPIIYDKSGNPLTYYDGYNYTFVWTEGRRLASSTYAGKTTAYEYDHTGLRTRKNNPNGTYIVYHIANGQYLGETQYGADHIPDLYIRYIYDENNTVTGFSLWYAGVSNGWDNYYFIKNLQGDVLKVYRAADSTLAASYTYDAWGNILSAKDANGNDALTTPGTVAYINPFRYRGYYFDNETWFYYLQSRYYDPAIGRFVNADVLTSTGQGILGYNMFAYCGSNPVNRADPEGLLWGAIWDFFKSLFGIQSTPVESTTGDVHVMSNASEGWMKSSATMGENMATALGVNSFQVSGLTNDNFCDTWNNTTAQSVIVHTHGSPSALQGDGFNFNVENGDMLQQNTNIKCLLITACSVAGNNGTAQNMGQLLSTKIAEDGIVICCTTPVSGGATTFKATNNGMWVAYQNGVQIDTDLPVTITMDDAAAFWKSRRLVS